jgi:hypothetical protein
VTHDDELVLVHVRPAAEIVGSGANVRHHLGVLEKFLAVGHRNVARDPMRHVGHGHQVTGRRKLGGNAPGKVIDTVTVVHQHDRGPGRIAIGTVEIDVHRTSIDRH